MFSLTYFFEDCFLDVDKVSGVGWIGVGFVALTWGRCRVWRGFQCLFLTLVDVITCSDLCKVIAG